MVKDSKREMPECRRIIRCPKPERKEGCLQVISEIMGNPCLPRELFDLWGCPWVKGLCPYKLMTRQTKKGVKP